MHPAVYAALTEARETEIRTARRHHHTPARQPQQPRRRFSIRVALRTRRLARA
jgi:hypothetical protein